MHGSLSAVIFAQETRFVNPRALHSCIYTTPTPAIAGPLSTIFRSLCRACGTAHADPPGHGTQLHPFLPAPDQPSIPWQSSGLIGGAMTPALHPLLVNGRKTLHIYKAYRKAPSSSCPHY